MKGATYQIKVDRIAADGAVSAASMYTGEFKIKMTSIQPNYDYTVYNMHNEPIVKTSE